MVDEFVKQIESKIRLVRQAHLKYQLLNAFEQTIRELHRLERSKDIFTIVFDSTIKGGVTQWKNNGVLIKISDKTDYGLIGHELKHAYQFMKVKYHLINPMEMLENYMILQMKKKHLNDRRISEVYYYGNLIMIII